MRTRRNKKLLVAQKTLQDIETINAIQNLYIARSNFNDADDIAIDLSIFELLVAEERLNLLIRDRKDEKTKLV